MKFQSYPRALGLLLAFAGAVPTTAGCAASRTGPPRSSHSQGALVPTPTSDAQLGEAALRLLRNAEPTQKRQALLAGVVQRQLQRADRWYTRGNRRAGLRSVLGALYLIRVGELHPAMVKGAAAKGLGKAVAAAANEGDEGRSLALYQLRKLALAEKDPARGDTDAHLQALQKWAKAQEARASAGPVEKASDRERRAMAKALLLADEKALRDAVRATNRWVDAGLQFRELMRKNSEGRPSRDEAIASYRALASGAMSVAALHLRYGDAAGALKAVNTYPLSETAPPGLIARLEKAVDPGSAEDWQRLVEAFSRRDPRPDETTIDPALMRAASFGAAVEAFRRDRSKFQVDLHLALSLGWLGMGDAAPLVLSELDVSTLSAGERDALLKVVARTLALADRNEDPEGAARVYRNSEKLLKALAVQTKSPAGVRAEDVHAGAAVILGRAGALSDAERALAASGDAATTPEARLLAAAIARAQGEHNQALDQLERRLALSDAKSSDLIQASVFLRAADIELDRKQAKAAQTWGEKAAQAAAKARTSARSSAERVEAERQLAKALHLLGAHQKAIEAEDRALATTGRKDDSLLLLEMMSQALIFGDLNRAKALAAKPVAEDLPTESRVYFGLWLQALCERNSAKAPANLSELLSAESGTAYWPKQLSRWGQGKVADSALLAAAQTPAERTEANFYVALRRWARKKAAPKDAGFDKAIAMKTLMLFEVRMARWLAAGKERHLKASLPTSLPLP